MANISTTRSGLRAYASELFIPEFVSRQYNREPLLSIMAHQQGSNRELRPASTENFRTRGTMIGGANLTRSQRRQFLGGGHEASWGVHTGTTGGVKNLTARDTVASISDITTNSQDQKKVMTSVRWSHKQVEVVVWNSTRRLNRGPQAIMSAVDDALGIGMQDLFDSLIDELWIGNPSDQTADYYSEQIGVDEVCKDDNTCYGLDRSGHNYFDGKRVTGAKSDDLALIDDANITQGIMNLGPGVTLCLTFASKYLSMKAEALSKGGTLIHRGMPQAALFGIKDEAIMYGRTLITYTPGLKDYSAITSGDPDMSDNVFMGNPGDWVFQTQTDGNFAVGEFIDIGKYSRSGQDARRSLIDLVWRFFCIKPWLQILYTAVT